MKMEFGVRAILFVLLTYKTYIGILYKLINMSLTVRTKLLSPTGAPHVGTAYMALFNLAYARKHGGK